MRDSQRLINMEISREDILKESEFKVDSTTPVSKRPKLDKKDAPKNVNVKAKKKQISKAKIEAERKRAKQIFAAQQSDSESDPEDDVKELKREVQSLKSKLAMRHSSTPPEKPGLFSSCTALYIPEYSDTH